MSSLTKNRWYAFSRAEQMANIGSEYSRFIHFEEKKDIENMTSAFDRLIELIDFSLNDEKWRGSPAELLRLREVVCDKFIGEKTYNIPAKTLEDYFLKFALLVRK